MADQVVTSWDPRNRIDEELEFFTELALQETERWVQVVTRLRFKYPENPRKSLENGVLLLELLNNLKPGCVRKINRFPGPIAGLDNINVFLDTCQTHFGLKDSQLFNSCDLEDLEVRGIFETDEELKYETEKRLRNVAITLYWLGKSVRSWYDGPHLDLSAFTDLVGTSATHVSSPKDKDKPAGSTLSPVKERKEPESLDYTEEELEDIRAARELVGQSHSRQESGDSLAHSSGFSSGNSDSRAGPGSVTQDPANHTRTDSYDSFISQSTNRSSNQDTSLADDEGSETSMPVRYDKIGNKPYSATFDSFYDSQDNSVSSTQSKSETLSPQEEYDRFRFGDRSPSNVSVNSEQSIKAMDNDGLPPTRNPTRRVSQPSYNPLQFVAAQSNPLAVKAKETLDVMTKQKEIKKATKITTEEEDWQSNLSNWKSRRKSASQAVYQRAVQAEEMEKEKEKEQEDMGRRKSKTWKEMQEHRQRRKSGGYNIYPYQEDGEDSKSSAPRNMSMKEDDTLAAFGFTRADDDLKPKEPKSKPAKVDYQAYRGLDRVKPSHQDEAKSNSLAVSNRHKDGTPATNGMSVTQNRDYLVEKLEKLNVVTKTKDGHRAWSWQRKSLSAEDTEEEIAPWAVSPNTQRKDFNSAKETNNNANIANNGVSSRVKSFNTSHYEQDSPKNTSFRRDTDSNFSSAKDVFDREDSSMSRVTEQSSVTTSPGRRTGVAGSPNISANAGDKKPLPWEVQRSSPSRIDWKPDRERAVNDRESRKPESPVSAGSRSPRSEQKHVIEKTIKISQKPNHPKGFGFTIKGGRDLGAPITVGKVVLGGAADVCELMPKDEILSINGADLTDYYQDSVQKAIDMAAGAGHIELRIRRSFDKASLQDEDVFSDEQEEEQVSPTKSYSVNTVNSNSYYRQEESKVPPKSGLLQMMVSGKVEVEERTRDEPPGQTSHVVWERNIRTSSLPSQRVTSLFYNTSPNQYSQHAFLQRTTYEPSPMVEPPQEAGPAPEPDKDEPPPLPSAPPPAPNWDTFPGGGSPPAASDSFLVKSDLVPDSEADTPSGVNYEADTITRIRTDILRKKSEFLGLSVDKSEEYNKFKAEKEKELKTKEEPAWEKFDKRETSPESSILEQLRRDAEKREQEAALRENEREVVNNHENLWQDLEKSEYDLEQQEREIIENLEREERERQLHDEGEPRRYEEERRRSEALRRAEDEDRIRRQLEEEQRRERDMRQREEQRLAEEEEERWRKKQEQEKMRAWKSMEFLKQPYTSSVIDINGEAPGSRDMESMMPRQKQLDIQSSHRFFNLEEERQKMENWQREQDRKRQDQPNQYSYGAPYQHSEKPLQPTASEIELDKTVRTEVDSLYQMWQEQFQKDQENLQKQMEEDMVRVKKIEEEKKKELIAKTDNNMNVLPGEVHPPTLQKTLWQFVEEPNAKEYTYKWEGMDLAMPKDLLLSLPLLVKPKYNQYEHMNFSNYYKKLTRNLSRLATVGRSPTPPPTTPTKGKPPAANGHTTEIPIKKEETKPTASMYDSDILCKPSTLKRTGLMGPIPFGMSRGGGGKPQKLSFRPRPYISSTSGGEMSDSSSLVGISSSDTSDISELEVTNRGQPRGADFPAAISPSPILVDVADRDMDAMVMKNSPLGKIEQYADCSADDESGTYLKELEKRRGSSPEDFSNIDLIDLNQLDQETEEYLRGDIDKCDAVEVNETDGNLWSQIISGIKDDVSSIAQSFDEVPESEQKLLEKDLAKQRELEEVRRQREEFRRQEEKAEEERIKQKRAAQQKESQESFPWNSANEWSQQNMILEQERILEEREKERIRQEQERDRRKEQERKRREGEDRRKREEAERRKIEEERRKVEEEHRKKHEADTALRQKEEELRMMEERIRQESERLKQERERFERERSMTPPAQPAYTVGRVGGETQPQTTHTTGEVHLSYVSHSHHAQVVYRDHSESPDRPMFQVEVSAQRDPPPLPKQPPPVGRKPAKKEPAIQPKPSIKQELVSSRREIIDQNKRPGAVKNESPRYEPMHIRTGSQEMNLQRAVVDRRPSPGKPDDPVRRSWHEQGPSLSPRYDAQGYHSPQLSPGGGIVVQAQMSKKTLHSLNQVPRSKLVNNDAWVKDEPQSRSQIMRQNVQNVSQHWLVEEAERRRLAEQGRLDRPSTLASRSQPAPVQQGAASSLYDSMYPEQREGQRYDLSSDGRDYIQRSYSNSPRTPHQPLPSPRVPLSHSPSPIRTPTHVTEVERPEAYHRAPRPLPDSVKQTLIDRVNHQPRSPGYQAQPSHSYQSSPHYTSPMSTFKGPFPDSPVRYDQTVPYTGQHPPVKDVHHSQQSSHQVYHERSASSQSSQYSAERVPPVPPKPPRLLSSSSDESHADHVASVSGAQGCSHCEDELGQGAAMVIESLGLYYHIACFRCCVCQAQLGTGIQGADVRIRGNKLHCQNCYSNDEVGLKYSRV